MFSNRAPAYLYLVIVGSLLAVLGVRYTITFGADDEVSTNRHRAISDTTLIRLTTQDGLTGYARIGDVSQASNRTAPDSLNAETNEYEELFRSVMLPAISVPESTAISGEDDLTSSLFVIAGTITDTMEVVTHTYGIMLGVYGESTSLEIMHVMGAATTSELAVENALALLDSYNSITSYPGGDPESCTDLCTQMFAVDLAVNIGTLAGLLFVCSLDPEPVTAELCTTSALVTFLGLLVSSNSRYSTCLTACGRCPVSTPTASTPTSTPSIDIDMLPPAPGLPRSNVASDLAEVWSDVWGEDMDENGSLVMLVVDHGSGYDTVAAIAEDGSDREGQFILDEARSEYDVKALLSNENWGLLESAGLVDLQMEIVQGTISGTVGIADSISGIRYDILAVQDEITETLELLRVIESGESTPITDDFENLLDSIFPIDLPGHWGGDDCPDCDSDVEAAFTTCLVVQFSTLLACGLVPPPGRTVCFVGATPLLEMCLASILPAYNACRLNLCICPPTSPPPSATPGSAPATSTHTPPPTSTQTATPTTSSATATPVLISYSDACEYVATVDPGLIGNGALSCRGSLNETCVGMCQVALENGDDQVFCAALECLCDEGHTPTCDLLIKRCLNGIPAACMILARLGIPTPTP